MGQFNVEQRTKDGMFNATALLKQWNEHVARMNENPTTNGILKVKDLKEYFDNKSTQEFIRALVREENLNGENSPYLKSRGRYNGGTWMHPLLFVDFAMWLNPTFKVKVLKFVYDKMLEYRNDAGDAYLAVTSAVAKIAPPGLERAAFGRIGKAINWCVFNSHEPMLRNKQGEEIKMQDLWQFERKIADLINEGFIKSYDDLISYLGRYWREHWTPKDLTSKP